MAIYNNREVTILGPNKMASSPDSINVKHINDSIENVPVGHVYFTPEEKEDLLKKHPSKYQDVKVASKEDISAVKEGKAPTFDPSHHKAEK